MKRNMVRVRNAEAIVLEGLVRLEEEKTDDVVTTLWLTNGERTYAIRSFYGTAVHVYRPVDQPEPGGKLESCPAPFVPTAET